MIVHIYTLFLHLQRHALLKPGKFPPELKYVDYSVEVSIPEFFKVPEKLSIPVLASSRVNLKVPSAKVFSSQKKGTNSLKYNEFDEFQKIILLSILLNKFVLNKSSVLFLSSLSKFYLTSSKQCLPFAFGFLKGTQPQETCSKREICLTFLI